ncbi:hypothetical protein HMPREF9469_00040, partial [, partial [[Clostridium] citroniae WAL-17108]
TYIDTSHIRFPAELAKSSTLFTTKANDFYKFYDECMVNLYILHQDVLLCVREVVPLLIQWKELFRSFFRFLRSFYSR